MWINSLNCFSKKCYLPGNYGNSPRKQTFQPRISFGAVSDTFDYEAELNKKISNLNFWQKMWGGKKKAKKETTMELIGFNLATSRRTEAMAQLYEAQAKIIEEKEKRIQLEREKCAILSNQLAEARISSKNAELVKQLRKELDTARATMAQQQQDCEAQKARLSKLQEEQSILTKRKANKGWGRVAGREDLKTQLEETFINKIAQERSGIENVKFPNGILLYGQSGTGKTLFAKAFAEQADCHFVEIDMTQEDDDVIDELFNELKKAKKRYASDDTSQKRTIILLDDFDAVAQLSKEERENLRSRNYDFEETNVGRLVDYLGDCASKYKATIFMTTNYPRRLDSRLLNQDLVPYQVFLGPPTPKDAAQILEYYISDYTKQDIDYDALGWEIAKAIKKEEAYSAQGIRNIAEYAKEKTKGADITENDLRQAIKEVAPDIAEEQFKRFFEELNETLGKYIEQNKEIDE